MPIYLPAPALRTGGPDGRGWNRISIAMGALVSDECALKPRDYTHLRESQDTRRARYGGYGPCTRNGDCGTCPVLQAPGRRLRALGNQILVRISATDGPHLMNRSEDGWASLSQRWTWSDLARIDGWEIGRRFRDEHSDGFWLIRAEEAERRNTKHSSSLGLTDKLDGAAS
ncbi:hypothetical protein [Streptomyces sp. NPDC059788]|uniref:hypothetical protein n=1 Tax=Streptomyces sp. NPDC059788 TaxID=3346948 RepID=UPI003652E371